MSITPINFQWIDTQQKLVSLCEQLSEQTTIALDTEFIRSRTYYPHIGLLQVADEQGIYLIDPLAIKDLSPFARVLTNASIIKVIHACSEDLEVFLHSMGVLPASLFDTQVAAAFTGYGSSIGYANLLREIKGVDIPKEETRSDWLQRPLSDSQLRYAALDVEYLLVIYQHLQNKLQQYDRVEWVESDCDAMVNKLRHANHMDDYYLRVKSAWKLRPQQLAVLQHVCRWREQQAKNHDVPRSRILKDSTLYDIAARLPKDIQQLSRMQDMYSRVVHESGEYLLSIVEEVIEDIAEEEYPEPLPAPLHKEHRTILKALKKTVAEVANTLDLPPELLVRKKDYEALLNPSPPLISTTQHTATHYQLPVSLTDWRQGVIGQILLDRLHCSDALGVDEQSQVIPPNVEK